MVFLFFKVWLFNFFVPIWIFCFYGKIKLTYLSTTSCVFDTWGIDKMKHELVYADIWKDQEKVHSKEIMAKKLCLKRHCGNDGWLGTFIACKLFLLDKNAGVRPIWIREVIRRILGCAVMTTFGRNILEKAGNLQLCPGHVGYEAAVDAFNRINWFIMLHNIGIICSTTTTYVINSYSQEAWVFIIGGEPITST